jgi:hypothetical protein
MQNQLRIERPAKLYAFIEAHRDQFDVRMMLIAEGGARKNRDRAMLVGLVFRPTTDGLVRDDATPPGIWDLLTRRGV